MKRFSLPTSRLYLGLSILGAILAALTLFGYFKSISSRIAESGRLIEVVVAARDLEAGQFLDSSCFSAIDFPDRYLLPGTFTDTSQLSGNSLRYNLTAGEPFLESSLLRPQSGGLAQNALDPGFRAYPLPAGAVSFPVSELSEGTRVDVIAVGKQATRPLLENVEVLGVSGKKSTVSGDNYVGAAQSEDPCILLQLTCDEACRLALAEEEGKVELILRTAQRI
ncbi:MAG: Flp pilus assembly protein CpaB [Actinobacteria bacterium RBG_19FT_COMBO_54_7]|uniref:Flp pilus assembly protein CpaB n=1 Tax=Candidatus Solincola sediminis TaxID=1797199 RepID=A0A1F2WUI9_9ACTN|nr:MAG: Flp pilus assembly protein CpaB [Candidatus Solincola sediminis]OFW70819.1 MAG: Flp pilus assembly protein CpaB [Actinobacteria bacterium RBG_19FT_COMBO_54_7]